MNSVSFFFLLILTLIVCHILQSKERLQPDVLVVLYETDKTNGHLDTLEKTLIHNKYRYKVISDREWKGFGGKIKRLQAYLKGIHSEQIVLVSDARDVLSVNYESSALYEKIHAEVDDRVIISSEMGCCVPAKFKPNELRTTEGRVLKRTTSMSPETANADFGDEWISMFKKRAREKNITHNSIFLNAGLYVGKVKTLLRIYALMDIADKEDHQLVMSEIFFHHPKMFCLDYNRKIFSNSHVWNHNNSLEGSKDSGCFYVSYNKNIVDMSSNTVPFFVHTPGKHFRCYDYVHALLLN